VSYRPLAGFLTREPWKPRPGRSNTPGKSESDEPRPRVHATGPGTTGPDEQGISLGGGEGGRDGGGGPAANCLGLVVARRRRRQVRRGFFGLERVRQHGLEALALRDLLEDRRLRRRVVVAVDLRDLAEFH
jgi:hypothetical protein